jgi:ubiquinone/menaquinone biosynthesis C-methylase UbiE
MPTQAHFWSKVAPAYETEFIDPYRPDVRSPLLSHLQRFAGPKRVVADLGCGIGPLLPFLAQHFGTVHAVDFAAGMLERARQRCGDLKNVCFLQQPFTDLTPLDGQLDVAVAVNSLVMQDIRELDTALEQIGRALRPGGALLAIVPAMDAVHYLTMLLVDRALARGMPLLQAQQNAAHFGDHGAYNFAFGEFRYLGLTQHFWQPFEVRYRFKRAGFRRVRMTKVVLAWEQFSCATDLYVHPPPWDWFVRAEATG